jgi:hypothetical protein
LDTDLREGHGSESYIFTKVVLDFKYITQHPDNKNIIWKRQLNLTHLIFFQLYWRLKNIYGSKILHAKKTCSKDWKYIYIWLTFNSYISDDNFFSKVYVHYRHKLAFSGDFLGQEGVHNNVLCNPNDGIHIWRLEEQIKFY